MTEMSPLRLIQEAIALNITANTVIDISDVEKDILKLKYTFTAPNDCMFYKCVLWFPPFRRTKTLVQSFLKLCFMSTYQAFTIP